jgi:hypothetical protein
MKSLRLLATAALWVRSQKSLKNKKRATQATEWPTHSSPQKNVQKRDIFGSKQRVPGQ